MARRGLPGAGPRAGLGTRQPSRRRAARWCGALSGLVLAIGCGQKGPPLPPIVRVPRPVATLDARRLGADVYVTFTVPSQNVDASEPADLARVDVLALTAGETPSPAQFREAGTRIASVVVEPPVPGAAEAGLAAAPDAIVQGASVTVHEALEPDQLKAARPSDTAGLRRYYTAVLTSARNRPAPAGAVASVPAGEAPPRPEGLTASNTAETTALSWRPSPDAAGYNVYRAPEPDEAAAPDGSAVGTRPVPQPLNEMLLTEPAFAEPVTFGERRCYLVRLVLDADGSRLEGEPAEACHTAQDTFAPAAPAGLRAVASDGGIALRWMANAEPDLAGYLILRGSPADATLLRITPAPIEQPQYVDRSVTPGERYAYAAVAVDARGNESAPSERDQATAPEQ